MPDRPDTRQRKIGKWARRRWRCFRHGHVWTPDAIYGPAACERCGKTVDWLDSY